MKSTALALLVIVTLPVAALLVGGQSPASVRTATWERGKYLVAFGGCNDCHTPLKMTDKGPEPDRQRYLAGHPQDTQLPPPPDLSQTPWFAATAGMTAWTGPWGTTYAANLTPDPGTGMGIWSEEMFVRSMRMGKHMGHGRKILPPMPWQSVGALTDADLKAIFAYLRSLPPVRNRVPDPLPPGRTTGYE